MRGKTIRQFLIDGIPDGRWVSELSNWTGKAYKIPRTYINQCADRIDLEYTGVYFLFGQNENSERPQVYIGETENILVRLKQHLQDKDFWTECVAFISKDNNLNKAHIKYLENHLYCIAKATKRYEIINANTPTESSISEMDRAEMDEFIDNMRLILGVLGHKVLETQVGNVPGKHAPIFCLKDRTGAEARGRQTSDGFAILAGSRIAQNTASSLARSIFHKRQQLMDMGIIDANYTFTQDWPFISPSYAAGMVVGYSINGRVAWKDKAGVSLGEAEIKD